jgi:hypothetical protein
MTQMIDAPPPSYPPEQQWTDWGRTQMSAGPPPRRRGFFRASILIPLGALVLLAVLGGLFLMLASPAGAAGVCGGG